MFNKKETEKFDYENKFFSSELPKDKSQDFAQPIYNFDDIDSEETDSKYTNLPTNKVESKIDSNPVENSFELNSEMDYYDHIMYNRTEDDVVENLDEEYSRKIEAVKKKRDEDLERFKKPTYYEEPSPYQVQLIEVEVGDLEGMQKQINAFLALHNPQEVVSINYTKVTRPDGTTTTSSGGERITFNGPTVMHGQGVGTHVANFFDTRRDSQTVQNYKNYDLAIITYRQTLGNKPKPVNIVGIASVVDAKDELNKKSKAQDDIYLNAKSEIELLEREKNQKYKNQIANLKDDKERIQKKYNIGNDGN